MKSTFFSLSAALLVLTSAFQAFGDMGEYMAGSPLFQNPQWPDGLADMLNCPGRVYGFSYNFADSFFFAGDVTDFNDFLVRYAKLEGVSHKLTLLAGPGKTGLFNSGPISYDWGIAMSFYLREGKRHGDASVFLRVDGQVELDKVDVPANVVVEGDGANEQISKYIAARKAESGLEEETSRRAPPRTTQSEGTSFFKSERVLYAKAALTEDASRLLSVAFDESGGTRTGYDLVYADVNFNGKFEETERYAASAAKRHGNWLASSSFPPLVLDVAYNQKGRGVAKPCQVSLGYLQYPRHGVAEEISVTARVALRGSDEEWGFAFSGGVKPAKSLEKASTWTAGDKPTLGVFAGPDGYRKGNLGLGLNFVAGGNKLECWRSGQPVKAQAVIRKPDGEVVHRGEATPDKLSFG